MSIVTRPKLDLRFILAFGLTIVITQVVVMITALAVCECVLFFFFFLLLYVCVCVYFLLLGKLLLTEQNNKMFCQSSGQRSYAVENSLYQGPLSLCRRHSHKEPSSWRMRRRVSS